MMPLYIVSITHMALLCSMFLKIADDCLLPDDVVCFAEEE